MFRYGLHAVVNATEEMTVVGEATDGHQLLTLVDQTRPDVVLTGLACRPDDVTVTWGARANLLGRPPQVNLAGCRRSGSTCRLGWWCSRG